MDPQGGFWQRYAPHLVLLVVGGLLLLGSQVAALSDQLAFTVEAEPLALATETGATPLFTPVATANANLPQPTIDPRQFPDLVDAGVAPSLNPATYQGKLPQIPLQYYVVERNDTPNAIAFEYGIEAETLLGCNPQLGIESSLLSIGVELIICPEDGVLHDVAPGETLEQIGAKYGVPVADIIAFEGNNLEFPYRLYANTQLFIPGAVAEVFVWTPPALTGPLGSNSPETGGAFSPLVIGSGFFIWPVSNGSNITQYYWYGHPGLDIGLPEGTPVFATDDGTVTFAGWNIYCYGNLVVINHGNGYETFYAHLSAVNVFPGQVVNKGQVIGAVGNTGCSSGSHLHYEIRQNTVRVDPLSGFLP